MPHEHDRRDAPSSNASGRGRLRGGVIVLGLIAAWAAGCRSTGAKAGRPVRPNDIRSVVCLYDQKPWMNLDRAGDLDPEGIRYRVFLDPGTRRGVHRDGSLHIEMYQVEPGAEGTSRKLVSDWRYAMSEFSPIQSKVLGLGYHVRLRWAAKSIAGSEIEIVTRYEAPDGAVIAAGTKRLRVPKSRT
jgi:hypothetical protein